MIEKISPEQTDSTGTKQAYHKNRTNTEVGETVEIPGGSVGVTVSDLCPFGVQVSWLEPTNTEKSHTNELTVHCSKSQYTDETPVVVPTYAAAYTVWEPPEASETIVYWLA